MSSVNIVEALAIATGREPGSHADAFRVINAFVKQSWFEAKLAAEGPPGTDADDVRQKVMLELLRSGQRPFEGTNEDQARAFLGTIAVRRAIDTDRTRRKREVKLSDDSMAQLPSHTGPYDSVVAEDLSRRIDQLIAHAKTLSSSANEDTLRYHLRRILLGMPATDSRPGADDKVRARLRQERSRALSLLRRAHEASIAAEKHLGRPDEIDWVVERILETPKTLKSQDDAK